MSDSIQTVRDRVLICIYMVYVIYFATYNINVYNLGMIQFFPFVQLLTCIRWNGRCTVVLLFYNDLLYMKYMC